VVVTEEGALLSRCEAESGFIAERPQEGCCFVQVTRAQKQIEVVETALREVAVEKLRLKWAFPGGESYSCVLE
jgi:hypothetical protein